MTSTNAVAVPSTHHKQSTRRNPMGIIAVAAYAAFLATFNETLLNVAFAPIMTDFNIGVSTVQWLATAYMLGVAVMIPISAFAYRNIPTRTLFVGTTALLILGSAAAGTAQNFAWLLIGRVIQAIGSGMIIPIGMNITLEVAPKDKLGACMGLMAAMTTIGVSASVIVSGLMLSVFEWHALIWMFCILCILCLICGAIMLDNNTQLTHPKLDAPSVALIALALVGILYGISTAFSDDLLQAGISFVLGCAFLWVFVCRQRTLEEPLINVKVLLVKPFTIGVIINILALIAVFSMTIIIPTFLQSALGTSSLDASLSMFPAVLICCFVSPLAGRIYDKHGIGFLLPLGFACICVFSVLLSLFIGAEAAILRTILFTPIACGAMLIVGPVQSFALAQLSPEQNAHGVTVMTTGFQISGCLGSSLFTGVYAAASSAALTGMVETSAAALSQAYGSGFLASGLLTAAFALVGFGLACYERKFIAPAIPSPTATNLPVTSNSSLSSLLTTHAFVLHEDDSMISALNMFVEKGISGAPVVTSDNTVIGFLSDGDVVRFLQKQTPAFKNAYSFIVEQQNSDFMGKIENLMRMPVRDVATKHVITAHVEDDLGDLCSLLTEKHLKKIPVVHNGKLVGILSRSNITRFAVRSYLEADK